MHFEFSKYKENINCTTGKKKKVICILRTECFYASDACMMTQSFDDTLITHDQYTCHSIFFGFLKNNLRIYINYSSTQRTLDSVLISLNHHQCFGFFLQY